MSVHTTTDLAISRVMSFANFARFLAAKVYWFSHL